jgi:prepilin-type N-terminal cleavage/methylation domain-containing protein
MYSVTYITSDHRSLRRGPGFSLIELVLVMTIISILAAIAVPKYAGALARYHADAAARRVVSDLEYARQLAQTSSATVSVELEIDSDMVHLVGVSNLDNASGDWRTELNNRPYNSDLVSVDFGGDAIVIFNGFGDPDSGGTAVVTAGSVSKTIILNAATGKAVVQ